MNFISNGQQSFIAQSQVSDAYALNSQPVEKGGLFSRQ